MKQKKFFLTISLLLCHLFSWGCCTSKPKIKIQRPVFFPLMVQNRTTQQITELSLLVGEYDTANNQIKSNLDDDITDQYTIFKMEKYRYNSDNYSKIAKIYLAQQQKYRAYKSKRNAPVNIDPLLDAIADSFLKTAGSESATHTYLEKIKGHKDKHQLLLIRQPNVTLPRHLR